MHRTLTNTSNASFSVTLTQGHTTFDGTTTGNVTVQTGAEIGGHGKINGTIGGAGAVGPGNSPGIMTATSLDPSSNLTFNFELTQAGAPTWSNASASGNDVLHLEGITPFTSLHDRGE